MSARATEFRIWQIASSVDWQCTASEIAKEMGVPHSTVTYALRRRGWSDRLISGRVGNLDGRMPVDAVIKSTDSRIRGRA